MLCSLYFADLSSHHTPVPTKAFFSLALPSPSLGSIPTPSYTADPGLWPSPAPAAWSTPGSPQPQCHLVDSCPLPVKIPCLLNPTCNNIPHPTPQEEGFTLDLPTLSRWPLLPYPPPFLLWNRPRCMHYCCSSLIPGEERLANKC